MEMIKSYLLAIIIFGVLLISALYTDEWWREEERRKKVETMLKQIGAPAMFEMLAEECTELSHAALKMARILRNENPTPKTKHEVWEQIIEEASDVGLCMDQLGIEPDQKIIEEKTRRFHKRMEEKE